MRCPSAAGGSRRQPKVCGEASRCSSGVLPLPVKAGEIVPRFGGQLARKGAHDALSDCMMQEARISRERAFFGKTVGDA